MARLFGIRRCTKSISFDFRITENVDDIARIVVGPSISFILGPRGRCVKMTFCTKTKASINVSDEGLNSSRDEVLACRNHRCKKKIVFFVDTQ